MIVEQARAKLNLALHVRGRRPDGYHELETLFAFVEAGDVLRARRSDRPSFEVTGPFAHALAGEGDNLVTRAVRLFGNRFGGGPWALALDKRLPVASGIGGGSADAAATLRALARLEVVALDDPGLMACADALGSDVPACLLGLMAIGRGRGERLEPAPGPSGIPVLLVNPGVAVSTAAVFKAWDGVDRGPIAGEVSDIVREGRNDLEAPARAIAPVIGEVLALLGAQSGVTVARMSGSGATCFATFGDAEQRDRAAEVVRAAHAGWWCCTTIVL